MCQIPVAHIRSNWLLALEKYIFGSVVTQDGVGNYHLIMTTTHIQDIALGNAQAPSARYHDLAVGVQEWRLTSINSILGGYKCMFRLLSISKGCIWKKTPSLAAPLLLQFQKDVNFDNKYKRPPLHAGLLSKNKQVIFYELVRVEAGNVAQEREKKYNNPNGRWYKYVEQYCTLR